MKQYKLLKDIIGATAGVIFEYSNKEYGNGVTLVEGKSLGQILDLIKALGIDNKERFEEITY